MKDYIKVNRKAYDIFAKQHIQRHEKLSDHDLTDDDWVKLLKENLIFGEEKQVLEIGPGTGRMLKILEERLHATTTAVELSKEMIKYAKEKSPHTHFIEGNVLEVDFDQEFDAIFMGAVIHNFPKEDIVVLLQKLKKWIKKEGRILIYTTIHDHSEEGYFEKEDYEGKIIRFRKKFQKEELKEMIEDEGFHIVFEMHTEEPERKKKWLTYIIQK